MAEPSTDRGIWDDGLIELGRGRGETMSPELSSHPMLAALREAGTAHVYGDTADTGELEETIGAAGGAIASEVDGNTVNQPLVGKVVDGYLERVDVGAFAKAIQERTPGVSGSDLVPSVYALLCGRIGSNMVRRFSAGRSWEASLQLHMGLVPDAEAGKRVGRALRRMVPSAFVKVPFAPHEPHCFLVARDLEREGIPVNFTSTFSARQAVAAALLSNVTRTNIFMGRLNGGLKAKLLGEHVDLEAQRALRTLRRNEAVKTELIVASLHDWMTFVHTAGCDVYTSPCKVLREYMEQDEVPPAEVKSRLESSYEDELGIADEVLAALPMDRIARLWKVEPEFVEFLSEYRRSPEYRDLRDGDDLYHRFDEAGFADFFHTPTADEWTEMRKSKLPVLGSDLTNRLPIDTLYTLLADADFDKYQEEIDGKIEAKLNAG